MEILENADLVMECLTRTGERLEKQRAAVERELAGARFRGQSDVGVVTATVDWQLALVSVDISVPTTRIRGRELAPQVTQAINRARAAAIAELTRVSLAAV